MYSSGFIFIPFNMYYKYLMRLYSGLIITTILISLLQKRLELQIQEVLEVNVQVEEYTS